MQVGLIAHTVTGGDAPTADGVYFGARG